MITLIFILATAHSNNNVTTHSDKPVTITPHPLCADQKDIIYLIDDEILCVGSATVDTIFKGGFE